MSPRRFWSSELEFRVNQAACDPDEGYVYFEFEFDEALVEVATNRPNGWRDRLAPDGSKTVAQGKGFARNRGEAARWRGVD
jgi:hypothetical protein